MAGVSADRSPLFEQFAQEQEQQVGYSAEFLQSHPASRGRAQNFAASFDPRPQYRPALPLEQADALAEACTKLPGKTRS